MSIPILGFGTGTKWKGNSEGLVEVLETALKAGITHIDTAEAYGTRKEVGQALRRSGIPRKNLWITDKYSTRNKDGPRASLEEGLSQLGLDYVDLFLIHTQDVEIEPAWKELEGLYREGKAKQIGVSNFDVEHLDKLWDIAEVKPHALQIEFHPYLQDQTPGIVEYAKSHGIAIEAYGALVPLSSTEGPVTYVVEEIARNHNRSTTQVLLRWAAQQGIVVVTTTRKKERILDLVESESLNLTQAEIDSITETGRKKLFRRSQVAQLGHYDKVLKKAVL